MELKTKLKWTLGILGAVLIGAIGSGVWEHILKPTLSWTRDLVLNLASLGIEKYKDETYHEIARGFREAASGRAYYFIVLLHVLVATVGLSILWAFMKQNENRWQATMARIGRFEDRGSEEPTSIQDIKQEMFNLKPQFTQLRRSFYIVTTVTALWVTFTLITYTRDSYVNAAIAHYHQAMRIATPYLTQTEEKEIGSAFSQVSRKADYVAVLSKLEAVALAHSQRIPQFEPW